MSEGHAFRPIAELSALLASGDVTPVELVEAALSRIEAHNRRLGCFVTLCPEAALAQARAAERELRAGRGRGRLHGIPVAHKDVSLTRGVRTTAHSRTRLDYVPDHNATHVDRLAEAGMIMIGKTNTTEFACGALDLFGVHRNPWNPAYYAGGSSGGSSAALAAGLVPAATGSDTGGSIRVPASFCGIVGVKPTYGRVSRFGLIPLSWSMDHVGPMARTAEDAAWLLGAMAGHDPRDPLSARVPVPDFAAELGRDIDGLVIGMPRDHFFAGLEPSVDVAVRAALHHLERLGARVEPVALPHAADLAAAATVITMSEAFGAHAGNLRRRYREYGARTRRRIAAGGFYTTADYQAAMALRTLWTRELDAVLRRVDALATPTLPMTAFPVEAQLAGPPDTSWGTRHFNLSGHPALTVPCGFTEKGLPVGLQLAGRAFGEARLFRVAHAYERSTAWHLRRPEMAPVAS